MTTRLIAIAVLSIALVGADGPCQTASGEQGVSSSDTPPFYATRFERTPSPAELSEVGRLLFFDPGLSASGRLACSSCHDPRHAFGAPDRGPTPMGGPDGTLRGLRATPSLRYVNRVPSFTEHMHDTDGDDSVDQGPAGGHTWDGRAQSAHDQARLPLLSPDEMANRDPQEVVARAAASTYAGRMREVFGHRLFDDPAVAFNAVLLALEVFQQSPAEFSPYSSRYDEYLRQRATLTEQELRGLALFNDPERGNCASCHPSAVKEGAFPVFTDYGFIALGAPRNAAIPANRDPTYYDLGLCGPRRTDLAEHEDYCGLFRTPTLRNVAARHVFFHNGAFATLEGVLDFYAERDLRPEKFYSRSKGHTVAFDDLPPRYRANVNHQAPFQSRPGAPALLSRADRADIVAFLRTLTDRDLLPPAHR